MERCRLIVAVVTGIAAAALTACSSTTSGTPTGSGAGGGGRAAPSGAITTPEGLASTLREGLSSTKSAHITLRISTGGQVITGVGDETLAAGKLVGLDLTETIPGAGTLRLIQLDGKTYAKLPARLNRSTKPWVLVSTDSSDPTIRGLAQSLQSSQSTAVDSAGIFAQAAQSITNRGSTTVNGIKTTHYYVVVGVAKLPTNYAGRSALVQAGISTLPIDLYVDSAGRPVQVTEQLTVAGKAVSTSFGVTRYNQPVTITAPPASQVGS
ncbi:hypothetical protein [uncultured Jatrophihabitans sp.]|uniref:hypothetical protein n=1 Tax=uncultured Jatrophihabitans sp. TaxID=1610747 RepID=UPI0035CB0FDD